MSTKQASSDCMFDKISGRVAVAGGQANIVAGAILKILVIPLRLVGLVSSTGEQSRPTGAAIVPLSTPLVLQ